MVSATNGKEMASSVRQWALLQGLLVTEPTDHDRTRQQRTRDNLSLA